jgi:arylsulfatase A
MRQDSQWRNLVFYKLNILYLKMNLSRLFIAFALILSVASADRPNVVFILADDMGYGDVGFNGQDKIKTPHLDLLAKNGMIMNGFYAGSTVCGPSRASLMSGRHTGNCKIRGNPRWTKSGKPIDFTTDDITLGTVMSKAGYACGYFGKWALNENISVGSGHPNKHGFEEFWGFNTHREAHYHWPRYVWHNDKKYDLGGENNWKDKKIYADDLFTDKALKFIDRHAGHRPFFVFMGYTIPHLGISSPKSSRKKYEGKGWPSRSLKGSHYHNDPDTNISYASMISHMDDYVGQLVKTLKKNRILNNTLVFFTSDNGHEYDNGFFDSNGVYTGKKRWLKEGGIRVPTMAFWPDKIKPGIKLELPFAFWDIVPTFAELAGAKPPEGDGISFVPSLKGQKGQKEHDYLYWEFNERLGPMQAIRFDGNWKAYREWDTKKNNFGAIQIYNLIKDPSEKNNLASTEAKRSAKANDIFSNARTENDEFPLLPKKNRK